MNIRFKMLPLAFVAALLAHSAFAAGTLELSRQIAESLSQIKDPAYKTIAFSRLKGRGSEEIDLLIDYSNVNLVKTKRFQVTDRSRLEQILTEQRYNLSDLVSADSYRQIGKLLGVDLFVYGTFYGDELVIKVIDVETSALAWVDIFHAGKGPDPAKNPVYDMLTNGFINSLRGNIGDFAGKVNKVSFWGFETDLESQKLMDYFSYAIVRDDNLKVVDRENLSLILNEQKLSLEAYVRQDGAKQMGELYGVDGFFYGSVKQTGGRYISSLKLMNIASGVIVWADLLETEENPGNASAASKAGGGDMAFVKGGSYTVGVNRGGGPASPSHRIQLADYFIDRLEVSNEEYFRFVKKFHHRKPKHWRNGRPKPGTEKLPVVLVNWNDANKFCRSASKRLPLEHEWEVAFRGKKGNRYPWDQRSFNKKLTNTAESKIRKSLPVDANTRDISSSGVRFMAGNVREWVGSRFRRYPSSSFSSPYYKRHRVIRGSSFALSSDKAVGWYRGNSDPSFGYKDVGFRCAKYAE